jgi:hypothetical protein
MVQPTHRDGKAEPQLGDQLLDAAIGTESGLDAKMLITQVAT